MNLVFFAKNNENWEKIVETKVLRKNAKLHHSVAKDQVMNQDIVTSSKTRFFCHFMVIHNFLMQKD